jgi:hypothetical protein
MAMDEQQLICTVQYYLHLHISMVMTLGSWLWELPTGNNNDFFQQLLNSYILKGQSHEKSV